MNNILPPVPNVIQLDPMSWGLVRDWLSKVADTINNNPPVGLGGTQGLFGYNDATLPASKMQFGANVLLLRNKQGALQFTAPGPGTLIPCDLTQAGPIAGGRDQAAVFAASSFIHFYFIWNPSTNSLNTIASLASEDVGPSLPAGYSHFAYIGAIPLDSSSNLLHVHIAGTLCTYDSLQGVLSGGVATTPTSWGVSGLVPPNATATLYQVTINVGNASVASFAGYFRPTGSNGSMNQYLACNVSVAGGAGTGLTQVTMAPGTGRSFDYNINSVPTSGGIYVYVAGYNMPNSAS
jgi:hypothetical protein